MSTKVLFDKTGTAGTTGANDSVLPASNTADAKGLDVNSGAYAEFPLEFIYTKSTQDATFSLEGSLDGTSYSPLAFVRLDTGATVASYDFTGTGRVLVKPVLTQNLLAIRPVAFAAGAAAAGDHAVVRTFYRGAV